MRDNCLFKLEVYEVNLKIHSKKLSLKDNLLINIRHIMHVHLTIEFRAGQFFDTTMNKYLSFLVIAAAILAVVNLKLIISYE